MEGANVLSEGGRAEDVDRPLLIVDIFAGRLDDDSLFSSLVIVNSDGNFPEPLCLRRLLDGPANSAGDACLERLRGLGELECPETKLGDIPKGLGVDIY